MTTDLIAATFANAMQSEFGRSLIAPGGLYEVIEQDVLGERMAVFRDRKRTVLDMLVAATMAFPRHEYLADDDRRLTFTEHLDAVATLAHQLRDEYGVQPGDRVGVHAANSLEWVIAWWAALAAGAIPTGMNSFWSDPELEVALHLVTPTVVLADRRRSEQLARVAPRLPTIEFTPDHYAHITSGPASLPDIPAPDEDGPALLMFTSGTTGKPKAVAHSHRSVVGTIQCNRFNTLLRTGAVPTSPPPPPRALVAPPLFHLSALYGAALMFLSAGGLLVFRPGRFDEARTMQAIQDERITVWLSVGAAAPRVATHPERHRYDFASVQSVVVGGAPLSPAVKHALCDAFPTAMRAGGIRMGYTSSEGGSIVASIGGREFAEFPESTGPVQDGVQVDIRSEDGVALPTGGEGLVWVRSAYTMLGYWGDPEATAQVYGPGRWLSMGDVGRLDGGRLYVNSRARDLILVSAENVYPSEVENRIEAHPAVVESCVAGIDDAITGQAIKAWVVTDGSVTADELAEWCRGGLPPYKVPTAWDLRAERLPRNPAGKIVRTALLAEEPAP